MGLAKCNKCGAKAEGNTPEEAINKLNHAVGLTRGIHCSVSSDRIVTSGFTKVIKEKIKEKIKNKISE